jgi:hypothetical protein
MSSKLEEPWLYGRQFLAGYLKRSFSPDYLRLPANGTVCTILSDIEAGSAIVGGRHYPRILRRVYDAHPFFVAGYFALASSEKKGV